MKNVTRISVALTLLLALLVAGQSSVASAQDVPDWQTNTTIQNIYENHIAWTEYTNELDDEFFETDDRELGADLIGEALGVTIDYLNHLDGFFPETNCAREMWLATNNITKAGLAMYSAMYIMLTDDVGSALTEDLLDWTFENFDGTVEYSIEAIPDKCFNKLDV